MLEVRHSNFFGGFYVFFDDVVHDVSLAETHVAGLLVGDTTPHVPAHAQQVFSDGSDFFVLPVNQFGNSVRARGQEADAKKFETSKVNGVS